MKMKIFFRRIQKIIQFIIRIIQKILLAVFLIILYFIGFGLTLFFMLFFKRNIFCREPDSSNTFWSEAEDYDANLDNSMR